jgi:hypothetical protein
MIDVSNIKAGDYVKAVFDLPDSEFRDGMYVSLGTTTPEVYEGIVRESVSRGRIYLMVGQQTLRNPDNSPSNLNRIIEYRPKEEL